MAILRPVYTTRETVKRALDQGEVRKNNRNIDRCVESASRTIEGICHRTFYPETATKLFDWPNEQGALAWRLWLNNTDLISVSALSSGGTTIAASDFNLEPNRTGPPYTRLEIKTSSSASFGGGSTHQQDISITGLWGYSNDEQTLGATVEALDASETGVDVDAATSAEVGVGSIIRIDSERMLVTDRVQLDTGEDVTTDALTANKNNTSVIVGDGTQFSEDEIILIDAERMLITDISSNTLTVIRAVDGSTLAAHTVGTSIFAPRTLTVTRGALGTTAATHDSGASVVRWEAPSGVEMYATAHALHLLMQEQTGWFRTMSASSIFGGTARRAATVEALLDERNLLRQEYGRKARTRTI